jgi:type II secretory pathway pseudopilin PulG
MHSIKCSACGFVGWGDAEVCKKCSAQLVPHSAPAPAQFNSLGHNQSYGLRPNAQLKQGLAICSLVIGILNLFTLGLLGVGAILGITLAIVALIRIKQNPSLYGGKGFATAGLVTSILSVAIIVPIGIIAAIAIPNLIASRRAANEGSTIQALRIVLAAESTYASVHGTYGTLEELAAEQLIDSEISAGIRHGYRITIDISNSESDNPIGFQVIAVPLTYPNSGRRSFYVDETGIIRAADAHGRDATKLDDPLNFDGGYSSRTPASRTFDPDAQY